MKNQIAVNIDQLIFVPPEANPNKMSDADFQLLVHSIDENGFLQPILVKKGAGGQWEIVDGNHRARAAEQAGYTTITAVEWDGSASMRIALQLSMNRLRGDLDLGMAAAHMKQLADEGWSTSEMTLTGFTEPDIEALLLSVAATTEEVLEGATGELHSEQDAESSGEGPYTLELVFDDAEKLRRAKRGLRKVVGKGRELSEAVLVLLDSKD